MKVWAFLFVIIWGGLSFSGKVSRYHQAPETLQVQSERFATRFLAEYQWFPIGKRPLTQNAAYQALVYEKEGCETLLQVAPFGVNDEVFALVKDKLGPDTAFFENGQFSEQPATNTFLLRAWKKALLTALGRKTDPVMPVLAVSPMPRTVQVDSTCSAPPPAEWAKFQDGT